MKLKATRPDPKARGRLSRPASSERSLAPLTGIAVVGSVSTESSV